MKLPTLCIAIANFSIPSVALAQWVPASEIAGQPVQVTTNGVTNTVYFDAGGSARIISSPGGRTIPASWTASRGQLCLYSNGASECWPYAAPFQAGQSVTLTSSCSSSSTWLAQAVNAAPPPPPAPAERGERGR